jgi:putative ABC transport system ATP-binding protein
MGAPVIDLVGVSRVFPGEIPVAAVRPMSLSISSGDHIAITGPSGSGKSTLLNLLGLLDRPTTGQLFVDGVDVARLPDRLLSAVRGQLIGFVFQSFHLLPNRSVLENVMLSSLYRSGVRSRRRAVAAEVVDRVGLGHRLHAFPSTLSGGERQRVAIARAVANRPRVVLCDEPTGNLDSAMTGQILDLLDELHRDGITLITVTHDSHVAARAPRQLHMSDGSLVEVSDV